MIVRCAAIEACCVLCGRPTTLIQTEMSPGGNDSRLLTILVVTQSV